MYDKKILNYMWRNFGMEILDYAKLYINNLKNPLYRKWYLKYRPKLEKFKNCHQGHDCFILGNGPSLSGMNLEPLKDYYTFGLNKIYLIENSEFKLNLNYIVSCDELAIEQSASVFESLDVDVFLSYECGKDYVRPLENIHFLSTRGAPYTFRGNIQERIHEGYTVTYTALQIAYFMGFKRVFLIGVDHSWDVDGSPGETKIMEGDDPNHFDSEYNKGRKFDVPNIKAMELSYHLARYFYRQDGREILDATVDGDLDIYPKVSYEYALDECIPMSG